MTDSELLAGILESAQNIEFYIEILTGGLLRLLGVVFVALMLSKSGKETPLG